MGSWTPSCCVTRLTSSRRIWVSRKQRNATLSALAIVKPQLRQWHGFSKRGKLLVLHISPGWRNGRRSGLKIRGPQGRPGSSPGLGILSRDSSHAALELCEDAAHLGDQLLRGVGLRQKMVRI